MANLARPVNMLPPSVERIIEFKGLNRTNTVEEGEMSDMLNMSPDSYPILTQRKPRGSMVLPEGVIRPILLLPRFEKIAMIATNEDGVGFYYDGVLVPEVEDLTESTRMVAINNRICFFPEKMAIDVTSEGVQQGTYKSLEANVVLSGASVVLSNVDAQVTIPIGKGLRYDDAIDIHITSYTPDGGSITDTSFDISCIIEEVIEGVSTDTIVLPRETFIEMTGEGVSSFTITGTLKRTVPDLDHVIEWNNRLWGASNADNTLYACKLGDPFNWNYFQGTSLDSYYAEQGSDGDWTGVAAYSGHLIFFKQDIMCRIYGTAPSNYQITNTEAFGVEKGSRQSVVTINDTVFYKSKIGIMAYSGGVPYCISDKLNIEFKAVVAGTEKRKYYASVQKKSGGYELLVFDVAKGLWHREDSTRFRSCATIGNKLYYVQYDSDLLVCSEDLPCSSYLLVGRGSTGGSVGIINPSYASESLGDMHWKAVFGPFDEYLEEHKIYSKLALRMISKGDCNARVYISVDDEMVTEEEYCTPVYLEVTNGAVTEPEHIDNAYTDENSSTYVTVNTTTKTQKKDIYLYFPSLNSIPDDAQIQSVDIKLGARYSPLYIPVSSNTKVKAYLCDSFGEIKSRVNWDLCRDYPSRKLILNLDASDYTLVPAAFKSNDGSDYGCFITIEQEAASSSSDPSRQQRIYGASLKVTYKTKWQKVEEYEHVSTKGDFIPIVPRRCDRYSIKIEGQGPCEVKTLTRRVRKGSFGRL